LRSAFIHCALGTFHTSPVEYPTTLAPIKSAFNRSAPKLPFRSHAESVALDFYLHASWVCDRFLVW
jgi:hypothetical protein